MFIFIACKRNPTRKLESEREAETETDLYSDESFEESSSEYERTPTFEFNMTPPSIGNSGCGNSNNTMDNVPVRYSDCQEQANTASDVSDIEDQPVESCQDSSDGIYTETQPGEMEQKSLEIEQADYEEYVNDDELNQMDAAIFGLLKSTVKPPVVTVNNYTKLNYMQDECPNTNNGIRSGKRRVHFASEPEIYEVPFSSREFDEPYFDVKDSVDTPTNTVQSESHLKSVYLDPYSKEFVDDLDDLLNNVEEDIEEEASLEENQNICKHVELITGTELVCREENYRSGKSSSVEPNESEALPHQELNRKKTFLIEENVTDAIVFDKCDFTNALCHEKENTTITFDNDVLEQGHKRVKYADLDANVVEAKSTCRPSVQNEESPTVTKLKETKELLPQSTEPFLVSNNEDPIFDVACTTRNDDDENAVLVTNEWKTMEDVTQKYVETLQSHPVRKMSEFKGTQVALVLNSYIDELIQTEVKQYVWEARNIRQDSMSETRYRQDVDQKMDVKVDTAARRNAFHQEMISENSKQLALEDGDQNIKEQLIIVDKCKSPNTSTSNLCCKDAKEKLVRNNTVTEWQDDLPREDSTNSREKTGHEMNAISAELEQLRNLYTKIGDIYNACNGKKKPDDEKSLGKSNVCQTRLSVLQETRNILASVAEMSEDFKSTLTKVSGDSAQHSVSLERELAQMKKEYLETLNKKNVEIESLERCNVEFKTELEEAEVEKRTIECLIKSINIENEKLLEQNDNLENELNEVLAAKQNYDLMEINRKHDDSESELSNFKDNTRSEIDAAAWEQMCSDKQNLEKDLDIMRALLKESEVAKTELAQQMKEMKTELHKMKVEQTRRNKIVDYAYLREQVEHLEGLLVLSDMNTERLQTKFESVENISAVSNDTKEFAQKGPEFKSGIKEQLSQSGRESTGQIRELVYPSEQNCQGKELHTTISTFEFEQFAKQIESFQDELTNQLRNEHLQTQRQVKSINKVHYERLKRKLICNEKNITSLTQFLQCNAKAVGKEREQDIEHQIRHGMEQIKILLKQSTETRGNRPTKEESMDDLNTRQLKELLKTVISLHTTRDEREMHSATFDNENDKTQELERGFQDLNKLLQETKLVVERNEEKLNERDHMVEELNRQLHKERKDREEQLTCKEREVNKLERQLLDSNNNVDDLQERLREISQELGGTKDAVSQKNTELTDCKSSLREVEDLLNTSRQVITEMQRELQETKQVLMEKSVALEYSEKYAEMLCNSTRTKDLEAAVLTNKLMNKVVCNVMRVEKFLQRKMDLKAFKSQATTSPIESSDDGPTYVNEPIREQVQVKPLEEKEKNIEDLKSSLTEPSLKQESASLKEKDNELSNDLEKRDLEIRDLKFAINHLKKELELRSTSEKEKENTLRRVTDDLQRKETEIKELESFIGDLKDDLESRSTLLKEKETELQQMTRNLQRKEMQIKDLESSIVNLKQDVELSTTLLEEKENKLDRTTAALQRIEMELKSASERSSMVEEERNSQHNKLMELKSHIIQQDGKIKELDMLVFTRDSQLKDGSSKVEKLQFQLDEKEQTIELLKCSLGKKDHDINSMTENIKKKMFEIMRLEKAMDNAKIEKWKSIESYQVKTRYLEQVVVRLKRDLQGKSVLLQVKDKELTKANLRIQVKEEEIGAFQARLRRLRDKHELALYKQTSKEREFKLADIKTKLRENNDKEKQSESEAAYSCQEENKREELEMDNNGLNLEVLMTKLSGEQVALAMSDRMQQMVADMNVMQAELETKRDENSKLFEETRELKEYLNRLQEQAIEQKRLSSHRLNNTLDHVRLQRAEIRRLKASQQDSTWGSEASTDISPQVSSSS